MTLATGVICNMSAMHFINIITDYNITVSGGKSMLHEDGFAVTIVMW